MRRDKKHAAAAVVLPASRVDYADLTATFNRAYQDYIVPLQLNGDELHHVIVQNSINLDASRVVLVDDQLIGLGLLGQRNGRGWIGGVGIVPQARGRGYGRRLMDALLRAAGYLQLATVQLEVISTNTPARRLYNALGFQETRELYSLECETPEAVSVPYLPWIVPAQKVLMLYEQLHHTPSPWQREPESLHVLMPQLNAWTIEFQGEMLAAALGFVTDSGIVLSDVGLSNGQEDALKALLTWIHQQHPHLSMEMVNIAQQDPALHVMQGLGYQQTLVQIEMLYHF
jgi:ribosomal protein S18 acetylase RimI-like enzyme